MYVYMFVYIIYLYIHIYYIYYILYILYIIYTYIYIYILYNIHIYEEGNFQYRDKFYRPTSFNFAAVLKGYYFVSKQFTISLYDVINKPDVIRDGSRTPTASKMEFSMNIVNGLKMQKFQIHHWIYSVSLTFDIDLDMNLD